MFNLKHIWSNWLVVYNSIAFIISVYIFTNVVQEALYHKDGLTKLYSKPDSTIRFPFYVLEFSLVIECFHLWFGIQNFGEHVLINWAINLFVLHFVLSVIPEVSDMSGELFRIQKYFTGWSPVVSTNRSDTCTIPTAQWA